MNFYDKMKVEHEKKPVQWKHILWILLRAVEQETVITLCLKHNISETEFYAWRRKYGGLEVRDACKLPSVEGEIPQ